MCLISQVETETAQMPVSPGRVSTPGLGSFSLKDQMVNTLDSVGPRGLWHNCSVWPQVKCKGMGKTIPTNFIYKSRKWAKCQLANPLSEETGEAGVLMAGEPTGLV